MLRTSTLLDFTTPPVPNLRTLSLHDALPIFEHLFDSDSGGIEAFDRAGQAIRRLAAHRQTEDPRVCEHAEARAVVARIAAFGIEIGRAPRLNSSHVKNSYAVFCLKKKNNNES